MKMVEDAPDGTDQLALPESLYSFQSSSSRNVLRGFTLIVHPGDFCDQNYHPLVGSGLSISDNWSVRQKAECLPTAICRVVERALIFPLQSSEQFMNTNQKPLWIRRVRTALLGAIAGVATLGGGPECSAHFPYRNGCGPYRNGCGPYRNGCWGGGWNGASYFSSFPAYRSFCYPAPYIHHFRPIVHHRPVVHYRPVVQCYRPMVIRPSFVSPWCYAPIHYYAPPVFVTPICNTPVYHTPICYPPADSIQVGYGTQLGYAQAVRSALMPVSNWLDDRDEYANVVLAESERPLVRPPMRLVSAQSELSEGRTSSRSVVVAKPAIKPLTATSSVWSDSAIGLVDEMVLAGDMPSALRSCDAMASNRQPMSHGIYLRHAILKLFTPDTETDLQKVLDLLNMSAAAGGEIDPSELGVSTLRDYLEPSRVGLQESLNQFSQNALEGKTDGAADLLLIATLLKLDGQSERCKLFASEAFERAAASESFAWHSLLAAVRK